MEPAALSLPLAERAWRYLGVLMEGVGVTIGITLGALAIAVALGLALAVLRTTRVPFAKALVGAYVEVFRGVPPLTQLFIIYFGLTYVGLRLDSFTAAKIGWRPVA